MPRADDIKERLACYQDLPTRKDWDNPSPREIAQSLKVAHGVNRRLVATVNELYDARESEQKQWEAEKKKLRRELRISNLKTWFLAAILGGAAAKGLELAALAIVHAATH
jgi:hypothetical protein